MTAETRLGYCLTEPARLALPKPWGVPFNGKGGTEMLGLVQLVGFLGVLAYAALFVVVAMLISHHRHGSVRAWWHE